MGGLLRGWCAAAPLRVRHREGGRLREMNRARLKRLTNPCRSWARSASRDDGPAVSAAIFGGMAHHIDDLLHPANCK